MHEVLRVIIVRLHGVLQALRPVVLTQPHTRPSGTWLSCCLCWLHCAEVYQRRIPYSCCSRRLWDLSLLLSSCKWTCKIQLSCILRLFHTCVLLKRIRQPSWSVILTPSNTSLRITLIMDLSVMVAILLLHPLPHPLNSLDSLTFVPGALPIVRIPVTGHVNISTRVGIWSTVSSVIPTKSCLSYAKKTNKKNEKCSLKSATCCIWF